MAFDWKNTGDYVSVADVIGTAPHSSAPPTSLVARSSALSCSQTERSTEEETPIARRAVSACVCATYVHC